MRACFLDPEILIQPCNNSYVPMHVSTPMYLGEGQILRQSKFTTFHVIHRHNGI